MFNQLEYKGVEQNTATGGKHYTRTLKQKQKKTKRVSNIVGFKKTGTNKKNIRKTRNNKNKKNKLMNKRH